MEKSSTTVIYKYIIFIFNYRQNFIIFVSSFAFFATLTFYICVKCIVNSRRKDVKKDTNTSFHVGFFHPYCNAGGGGERVLWCAIRSILKRFECPWLEKRWSDKNSPFFYFISDTIKLKLLSILAMLKQFHRKFLQKLRTLLT